MECAGHPKGSHAHAGVVRIFQQVQRADAGREKHLMNAVKMLTLTMVLVVLGACATSVPTDYPKSPSAALQTTQNTTENGRAGGQDRDGPLPADT